MTFGAEGSGGGLSGETEAVTTLEGTVERIAFQAPGGFSVLRLRVGDDVVTVVGRFPFLAGQETLRVRGRWVEHPRYGRQLEALDWQVRPAAPDRRLFVRQLLGDLVPGFGERLAQRVVDAAGADVLDAVVRDEAALDRIPGIGPLRRAQLADAVRSASVPWRVLLALGDAGLPYNLARKLVDMWGEDAPHRFNEAPYATLLALRGVDFATADRLLLPKLQAPLLRDRLQAGFVVALAAATREHGHVCLPRETLLQDAARVLFGGPAGALAEVMTGEDATAACERALQDLVDEGRLVCDGDAYYLPELHEAETACVEAIRRLQAAWRPDAAAERLMRLETALAATDLSVQQRQALLACLSRPLSILTGGPGTGKTKTIATLIDVVQRAHPEARILLAAPTGRAARRLAELTGQPASTLHRLLEFTPPEPPAAGDGTPLDAPDSLSPLEQFGRDGDRPLDGELLVVDEASMLDLVLAAALLRAVPDTMQVLLVGDVDQLEPVAPGAVLQDLIKAGLPVARLTHGFRQAQDSAIPDVAAAVREGRLPPQADLPGYRWLEVADAAEAAQAAVEQAGAFLREGVPLAEIQVLSPMHRGEAGVAELNRRLQAALNPAPEQVLTAGGIRFQSNDKVQCTRNLYNKGRDGIFNGHVGVIAAIDPVQAELWVRFDDELVSFRGDELADLQLAYCMTIHKSQGSEFARVIVVMLEQHRPLLSRRLLYTALTRASEQVLLIAQPRAVAAACRAASGTQRLSRLAQRLQA